ncbi:uncharacterized protein LOC118504285 [Anopheles stephensi]|uniref:uncharacterized protein LOC118504285 n=1 Tax=Anopheles stephensi TaxID=30069 RepID=UPI00165893F4|nr:uncharacterized protein LOC118504285 [Anopheles stephensi]XP_035894453.1 uncharacterized protein LOC118504285 [Anopheles stephensi]
MENSGQSSSPPVENMENGCQESLDQSRKDYIALGHSSFNGCCRLCLKGNCHLQKLFPGGYTEDVLISKIFECTTVEITFATDPDALICYSCVAKIEEFHRYREQCRSNDVRHKISLLRSEGGQVHTASKSALLPAKYIKKEIDSEGFEISAADFFPIDTTEQSSYGTFETSLDGGPIASVADSSVAVVDSTILNENGVLNDSDEDDDANENLLELMPERAHGGFTISYSNVNDGYDNNNEVVCEMPIKEEPQDFDEDDPAGPWNDYGMDDDGSMGHLNSTSLLPLLEDCPYSSNAEAELEEEQLPYREVCNDTGLVCIVKDGFLYVQKSNRRWKCRVKSCAAEIIECTDRNELQTNCIDHMHSREVRNTATDEEILQLLEHESSDDEPFRYVTNVRNGSSIVYKGYKYCMKHTRVDGTTYWKCRAYKGCQAALCQTPNNEFTTVGTHTHAKQPLVSGPNKVQPSYVTSVSTEGEGSPPKIKLRIARQTDTATTNAKISPEDTDVQDCKQIPVHKKQVFKSGYGHKIVKNTNGRTRLYFDGNLYVRESSRKEESGEVVVQWRCRRNYDMCGVKAVQHEDGLVEVLGEHDHASIKKTLRIPENATGTTSYEMLPTAKGGETMMLDGYRYVNAYCRPNGMSLWRCVGWGGVICRAKVIMTSDGMAYVDRSATHLHGKPDHIKHVFPKMVENTLPSRTRAPKIDEGGVESKAYPATDTVCKSDKTSSRKTFDECLSVAATPAVATATPSKTAKATSKSQPTRNYRVIKNKKGNKALVHAGYRYCRVRTRQDGSVSWVCKINKKTCRVALFEHPDGRLEWTNHRRHNHGPTDPIDPPKKAPPPPSPPAPSPKGKRTAYHINDDTFVNNEWFFVRNHKNGTTLIHAGYRYTKKGKRVNDTSLWRCAQTYHGCRAAIVLHPDETIAKFDDIDHTHPPPNTAMEAMEVIVGDPDEGMEQSNASSIGNDAEPEEPEPEPEPELEPEPDMSFAHFNGCIEEQDDPEANMRSLLNTMLLDVSDEAANRSLEKVVIPAAKANYKYVTNRRNTKSLVFRGYRYARSSMGVRADGSVRWTCQMNKKTCRVSVRILQDGSIEMNGQKHNHPQLPEDRETSAIDYDDEASNASIGNDDNNPANESDVNEEEEETHYFALNRSNGKSLIYQRNRFSRENVRPDGSIVWRCMMRSDCLAKVLLLRNNTCVPYRDAAHNHPPLDVLPKPLQYPEKWDTPKLIVKGDMLVYKQNRMKKDKSFSDGTALFKCTEVVGCKGIVKIRYEETDGEASLPVVVFDSAHNHPGILVPDAADTVSAIASGTEPASGKNKRKSPVKLLKYSPTNDADSEKEYQLFKNDRGQVSLVYAGYRFSLRNLNAKGDSSWKCRANKMCSAFVSFTKDGHVIPNAGEGEPKVMPHNHPINGEYIERAEPLELDQLHPPAHNLCQFVSNWVKGLYKGELGGKAKTSPKSTASHHKNNERKNTIYHNNYSYRLQTTKNGREFWRCTMFKARACRAGLFCTNNGTIIQYENGRQHNHDPAKQLTASIVQQSNVSPRKSHLSGGAKGKPTDGAHSPLQAVQKPIKRSQSTVPFEQSADEAAATPSPSYLIVNRDGIDTLHYERHRYAVSFSQREDASDGQEPKRWRCCLWNSRHQCPVELIIAPTDEIQFVTDPTHNHRPPPPESQESLDRQSMVSSAPKGTKKYELLGRSQKTVFYKGHKFNWKEERSGSAYYRCMCHASHDCAVTVKIDVNGLLYECSTVSHNHSPALDTSTVSVSPPTKPLTERNMASRQTRLEQCPEVGSSDYRFVRSCLGNSMIFEGHRYWLHSKLSCGLNVYRCRYQKQMGCSGSVYMDASTRLLYHRYDAEHSHEPLAEDAVAGIEHDTTNTSTLNVSELNNSCNNAAADTFDEQDLDTSSSNNNNLHTASAVVPKREVIITHDYSFMKDSLNKNQLFYEHYVYEMVPLQYRKNGDKFYSCLFAGCSASVKLLASGGLDISNPIDHAHDRPDLTDYRDVGRGSSDFVTLLPSTAPGRKPTIRFEGYQYCASADSQPLQDATKVFHCREKNRATGRCTAKLEMLPNGRVIVTGTHHHPKPEDGEDSKETAQSKIMVLGGRSYAYLETQPDDTSVWQCTDDPNCMAKVYKKPDGKLVYGKTKHVLRHLMPKLANHPASSIGPKLTVPTSTAASLSASIIVTSTVPRSVSSGNLRTKWYKGNRYNFYLTRRDGVQYWRCCKRMENKCEAGILCYPSGTIAPSNQWPHSHTPLNPSAVSPTAPDRQDKAAAAAAYTVKQRPVNDSIPDAKVRTHHSIASSPDASDLFIWHNGVQYSLRHRRPDGIRIYRCRNKPCTHSLVVSKHGKIISKNPSWHNCESRNSSEESKGRELVPWSNSATSGLGFDKPEIEDPDDLDDHNGSADIQPIVKRIRLGSTSMEMAPDNSYQPASEAILQTAVDSLPNLDTETDAEREEEPVEESHGGLLPTGDFMGGHGSANSTWGESEYIVHEFKSVDANEADNDLEAEDRPEEEGVDREEPFEELTVSESFGGSLTCHDASNL